MHPGRSSRRGRNTWSTAPCSILLLSVILPWDAAAMYQGNGQRDYIHRVYKVKVTEDVRVLSGQSQLQQKRDGNSCPASYSLCAASLGGDCCPENYACAQSSCYATTAAVSVCAGTTGQYACPLSLQGGCCAQGLICGTLGCLPPAGSTYTEACGSGYSLCPASMNGGCCKSGMGCALSSCYALSPATATLTLTTTEHGSALTITTTSVTTSTPTGLATATENSLVAKFYPSTVSKTEATATAAASSGGGLSKAAIGGIVAAAVVILIAVLVATFFIIKRLKHTEAVVQTHRETTSGTRTRQMTEKKSEVTCNVRVVPTPSEVDGLDYDPLMMNSSIASPLRPGQRPPIRAGSDTGSQPSLWSGQSATRWNSPSVNSDADDNGQVTYFELPPRTHQHHDGRPELRQSVNSSSSNNGSSPYTYYDFTRTHGRHTSDASELSAGTVDNGSQRRAGSPYMPIELGVDGEFRPELSGRDTEMESTSDGRRRRPAPRRKGTAGSINDLVSPMSTRTGVAQPGRPRRRGDSQIVSPMDGHIAVAGGAASGLGSIHESVGVRSSDSLHGHYGPNAGDGEVDMEHSPPMPGFVPLERPSQDGSERRRS